MRTVFEQVERRHGRLDVLVNDAWGGHEAFSAEAFGAPLWEQPLEQWRAMFDHGVRNQLVTLRYGAPLMIRSGGRLVVAPTFWDGGAYLTGNAIYDLAKAAISRLAFAAAEELRSHRLVIPALSAGCRMGAGVQPFRRPWAEDGEVRMCNDACS